MKHTRGPWDYDTYNTVFAGSESTHDLVEICKIPDEPETGESRERTRDEWYPESTQSSLRYVLVAFTSILEAA